MRFNLMPWILLGIAVSNGLGCRHRADPKTPTPAPSPSPVVTPAPLPAVDPLAYDKPVAGFMFEDLLKGPYCTVTVKNSDQLYLLANVMKTSADVPFDFTYYYPKDDDIAYHSTVLSSFMLTNSNCDLANLVEVDPVSILLAPITVYANKEFSGESACTVAAGSRSVSDGDLENYQDYIRVSLKSSDMCNGLTRGFLKSIPNIVTLYVKPN